jgi:uncharacterized membrane protein YphA (DoxX/SURF4 family)
MLAALFIQGGINTLRAPEGHAAAAKPVLDVVAPVVDKAIEIAPVEQRPDDVLLVKIDGVVKIVAGTMLAFGKFPRLASTALAASLIPTTFAGHRFWEETDPERKREQQIHFLKNAGLLGGLLIAAADTEGKPSIAWRGRKAGKLAAAAAAERAASVSGTAQEVSGRVAGAAQEVGGRVSGTAADSKGKVAGLAAGLAGLAPAAGAAVTSHKPRVGAELSSRAEEISAEWAKRAAKTRRRAEKRGAKLQNVAEKRSAELQKRAAKRSAGLQKVAGKKVAAMEKAVEKAFEKKAHGKKAPGILDQATKLGHDVAVRASAVGAEVAHQAEGAAKDVRRRAHALTH